MITFIRVIYRLKAHSTTAKAVVFCLRPHKICETAREILVDEHAVARVIARPFNGKIGQFKRTAKRKDFSLKPTSKTLLNYLIENNLKTLAIGKIYDLFAGDSISTHIQTKSNLEGLQAIKTSVTDDISHQLIFANLVEFDELCGHRRNPQLFAKKLEQFDTHLAEIITVLNNDDLLIITADHGCDPTFSKHTDHTREHIPLLVYNKKMKQSINLGIRKSFSDIAQTIADIFQIENSLKGHSFKEGIE